MRERLVIFDLDGTLVDTRHVMKRAYAAACEAVSLRSAPPFQEYMRHLGAPLDEILRKMKLPPQMASHFKSAAQEFVALASLCPNIGTVLDRLREHDYALGIFTGKDADRTQDILNRFAIGSFFDVVITGDDVVHGKPHPEGVNRILSTVRLPPEHAAYVGDSCYDIISARQAGVASIAVSWGMAGIQELVGAYPTALVHSPFDLFTIVEAVLRAPPRSALPSFEAAEA
jgi:3-amino-5-hydroxybenzoic acid synthesis related protein